MPITCVNEFKLLIDQMSNSQAYSVTLNIFLCSEYIVNIKRGIICLLGDSHHTSNRWKNYLCQISTFYGIKEVKQTKPWRGGDTVSET